MKVLKRLCAGLIAGVLLASSAAAAPVVKYDAVEAAADAKYDITVSDASIIAGNEYALLIAKWTKPATDPAVGGTVTTPTIDVTTLTYIDQTTAVADGTKGKVVFEDFIPKTVPDSVVLLGGKFAGDVTSPVVIGYIDAKGEIVLIGEASFNGTKIDLSSVTVQILDGSDNVSESIETTEETNGVSFLAPADSGYAIKVVKPGYLNVKITNFDPTAEDLDDVFANIANYAGDATNDGYINLDDLTAVIRNWGSETDWSDNPDVYEDGYVNLDDLTCIVRNWGTIADDAVIDAKEG